MAMYRGDVNRLIGKMGELEKLNKEISNNLLMASLLKVAEAVSMNEMKTATRESALAEYYVRKASDLTEKMKELVPPKRWAKIMKARSEMGLKDELRSKAAIYAAAKGELKLELKAAGEARRTKGRLALRKVGLYGKAMGKSAKNAKLSFGKDAVRISRGRLR